MGRGASGEIFGTYHLLDEIGSGGAGDVYRARHIHPAYSEKLFAIKRLHPRLADDQKVVSRFRREAYLLSMLEHPNIVKTVEAGLEGQELFIAMEFVDGPDLGALIDRYQHPFPSFLAVHICSEILAGLGYGHVLRDSGDNPLNIIHRDVKPSNVLVSFNGEVKLTDFGVATLTGASTLDPEGTVMGTMGYIAPEALTGNESDERSDLFAAGAILYEMLCGQNPFYDVSTDRAMRKNVRAQVPKPTRTNPAVSIDLERVILSAMERKPAERYPSAREFMLELMPHTPGRAGIRLGLAAFIRHVFAAEFAQRVEENPNSANVGRRIAVYAQPSITEKLLPELNRLNHETATFSSYSDLANELAHGEPITAIVVDMDAPGFVPEEFMAALMKGARVVPIIAVADRLDANRAQNAHAIGAADLLLPPFGPHRLVGALRRAVLQRPGQVENREVRSDSEHELRVMVVTPDYEMAAKLSRSLAAWGYSVDVSPTTEEAVDRTYSASPHGVVYDFCADPDPDPYFAERFRASPGIGLMPMVYLTDDGEAPANLPVRCSSRRRDDSDHIIATTFNQLRRTVHLGRTYTRYLSVLSAELRYGGRSYPTRTIDISRGGVLLRSDNIPAVGKSVRVVLHMPGRDVEMPGTVVRVLMPEEGSASARVGVSFKPAPPRNEEPLIVYLSALDHHR